MKGRFKGASGMLIPSSPPVRPLILKAMGFTAADLMKGKEGVILTLDNQLYEGGHVSFEKGQTIPAVPGEQDYIRTMEE